MCASPHWSAERADPSALWVTDRQGNRYDTWDGVTKADPAGRTIYSLRFAGHSHPPFVLAADRQGNAWVAGSASGVNLPLGIALSTVPSGAFIAKISPGGTLLAANYFGAGETTILAFSARHLVHANRT